MATASATLSILAVTALSSSAAVLGLERTSRQGDSRVDAGEGDAAASAATAVAARAAASAGTSTVAARDWSPLPPATTTTLRRVSIFAIGARAWCPAGGGQTANLESGSSAGLGGAVRTAVTVPTGGHAAAPAKAVEPSHRDSTHRVPGPVHSGPPLSSSRSGHASTAAGG